MGLGSDAPSFEMSSKGGRVCNIFIVLNEKPMLPVFWYNLSREVYFFRYHAPTSGKSQKPFRDCGVL